MKAPVAKTLLPAALPAGARRPVVSDAIDLLIDLYDPEEIWLFGSAAKGMANPKSDIDVLVITDSQLPRHLRGHEFKEAFLDRSPRFDAIFFTRVEFDHHCSNPNSFVSSVMKAATCVYRVNWVRGNIGIKSEIDCV